MAKDQMTRPVGQAVQEIIAEDLTNCPIRDVVDKLAGKWTLLIMYELQQKPMRFNALARQIPDISKRMLTQSLRELERDGFAAREVFPTKPPSVEYSLTPMGASLFASLNVLVDWAATHQPVIRQARETYDNQAS